LANGFTVYGVAKESSLGRSITAAASDNVKIYETLATDVDRSAMGVGLSNQSGYENFTVSGSSVLVNANLYLPIDFTAPAEKGQECFVIAAKRTENTATNPVTYKTKYFGQSTSLIPYKTTTNNASLTISKMDIIDTPVVTYQNINGNGMVFSLDSGSTISITNADPDFCFDADGYFYTLYSSQIKSNNPNVPLTSIDLYSNHGGVTLTSDLGTNIMYMYVTDESSVAVYKYPNFNITGELPSPNNTAQHWSFTTANGWPSYCVINNDIAYIMSGTNYIYKVSLLTADNSATTNLTDGTHIDFDGDYISDIIAVDNAVYILFSNIDTSWDYTSNPTYPDGKIGSFGGLIKYDPSTDSVITKGQSTEKIENTEFTDIGMYVYGTTNASSIVYKDWESGTENVSNPVSLNGNSILYKNNGDYYMNLRFPTISTPAPLSTTLSTSAFYGPHKFIAIKPKKLVISDDGIAFYTDSNILKYKNVDRIVTVNLDDFAMSVSETTSKFYNDYSNMISGPFSIGGTSFGSSNGFSGSLWYFNNDALTGATIGTSTNLRLGITLGE
nr:hypothetical protein [Treponemataceae bacterium]